MQTKQMGEVWIASDGDCSSIGTTEDQAIQGVNDAKVMTEKEKFFKYIEARIKEGLLDIRFSFTDPYNLHNVSEEEVYAELNRMNEAPTLEDPEIF